MTPDFDILIVGAGHAGASCAAALRQGKFSGSIALLSDERETPYERPPLSKDFLSGAKNLDEIALFPPQFWAAQQINLLLGAKIVALDTAAHRVFAADGRRFSYGRLVWAAGGEARRPQVPGADLSGLHVIRRSNDVLALKQNLRTAEKIVVIGAGFIGLETAAALRKLGKTVTVIEAADRVLARVGGAALSQIYAARHRAEGVDLRLSARLAAFEGEDGFLRGVRLETGELIPTDAAILGIGIDPAIAPLRAAGAQGEDGVDVDAACRTSLPDIYAIGDCARQFNGFAGKSLRIESVQNALDQAHAAAADILGAPAPTPGLPWFWSNQYDWRLQMIGLSQGHDEEILRGDPRTNGFSIAYLRKGRLIALDCINAPKDFVQGKPLIARKIAPDREKLADAAVPLKSLA